MRGKRIGQAGQGRELGAKQARPQDPEGHPEAGARHRLHGLTWLGRAKIMLQFHDIAREFVGIALQGAAERPRGELVGARRPAETEIDTARI